MLLLWQLVLLLLQLVLWHLVVELVLLCWWPLVLQLVWQWPPEHSCLQHDGMEDELVAE